MVEFRSNGVVGFIVHPNNRDDENTSVVLKRLRQSGLTDVDDLLTTAEYIFVYRGPSGKAPPNQIDGAVFDVVVRLPKTDSLPSAHCREIARAIREGASKDDVIYQVQFSGYCDFIDGYNTWYYDTPPVAPEGLNNCHFKTEKTITHDELRFRSRGEIAMYEELKSRNVLFFPNPAAVMGKAARDVAERVETREPDFLICFKGKWGILEINCIDHLDAYAAWIRE